MPPNATSQLGLPDTAVTLDVGSPFDYEANSLLYCPTHLPDPRSDDFRSAQHAEIDEPADAAWRRGVAKEAGHDLALAIVLGRPRGGG